MTPDNFIAELQAIRDRISELLRALDAEAARPAYLSDPLEADGAWRPAWLVDLNEQARKHRPDGYINAQGAFRSTPMVLIHSLLWWPIYYDRELTDAQRAEYEAAQRDGFGLWMQVAPSRWPLMPWPRAHEDRAPGGEVRYAVLAGQTREVSVLPTEDALRAAVESHYRASGFVPAE